MSTHVYDLVNFLNGKVAGRKLSTEVAAACGQPPISINVDGDQATLIFKPDLPIEQEANLAAVVAAHDGIRVDMEFIASTEAIHREIQITEDQNWQILGGVVTNPLFFIPDVNKVVGRVVGQIKTVGAGVELRLIEDGSETLLNSVIYRAPHTFGTYQSFRFQTDVPPQPVGENLYRLEGRLNGALSADIRFTSLVLLKVDTQ